MNNTIFAARSDGLGERLNAIFNAILLSEISGLDFKFSWPDSVLLSDKHHSIESVERIFSRTFITNYLVPPEVTVPYSYISFGRGGISDYIDLLNNAVNSNQRLVPQRSILVDLILAPLELKSEITARILEKMEFSDEIAAIKKFCDAVQVPKKSVAIHLRAGDIVYGRFSENPNFTNKLICAPIVSQITEYYKKMGWEVFLFGQESSTIASIASHYSAIDSSNFYKNEGLNRLEEAMADIFLMSKCQKIYSGNSGFSRFSSQIGVVKVDPVTKIMPKEEWAKLILMEVRKNSGFYSMEQKAYACFIAYDYAQESSDGEILAESIRMAREFNPDNLMFQIIEAVNYYNSNNVSEGERCLGDIFELSNYSDFGKFSRSRFFRVINKKTIKRDKNAFERFLRVPFHAPNDESPYLNALLQFFDNTDMSTGAEELQSEILRIKNNRLNG